MMAVIVLCSLLLSAWQCKLLFSQYSVYAGLLKPPGLYRLLLKSILLQLSLRLFQLLLQLFHPPLQLVDGFLHLADVLHVDLL